MITMKEFMELIDYKITESGSYGWSCYGSNAYQFSCWNGLHDKGGYSFNIVFSTKSQKVFEVSVCDYTNNRAYRMIHPDKLAKYQQEAKNHDSKPNQAWDDVDFIDLEVDDDFMEKALAIKAGENYDIRVMINFDVDSDLELFIYREAHKADMTVNDFVVDILTKYINEKKIT